MKKAYVFLAEGFETTEALSVIDILKRGGVDAKCVSISDDEVVSSAQGVKVKCDLKLGSDEFKADEADAIILPGGLPGATNLRDNKEVIKIITEQHKSGRVLAAICAAPICLEAAGISGTSKGTCYPGFEDQAKFKEHCEKAVCRDDNLITAQGPALSFHFAFAILEALEGPEKAKTCAEAFLMPIAAKFQGKA